MFKMQLKFVYIKFINSLTFVLQIKDKRGVVKEAKKALKEAKAAFKAQKNQKNKL